MEPARTSRPARMMATRSQSLSLIHILFAMTRAQVDGNDELVMHYMMEFYFESAAMILTLITVGKICLLYTSSFGRLSNPCCKRLEKDDGNFEKRLAFCPRLW